MMWASDLPRLISIGDIAEKSGIDVEIINRVVYMRWTPSMEQRQKIAATIGLNHEQIIWGHTAGVENLYG